MCDCVFGAMAVSWRRSGSFIALAIVFFGKFSTVVGPLDLFYSDNRFPLCFLLFIRHCVSVFIIPEVDLDPLCFVQSCLFKLKCFQLVFWQI